MAGADRSRRDLLLLALGVVAVRLVAAYAIPLTEDEAYYRLWAQHLQSLLHRQVRTADQDTVRETRGRRILAAIAERPANQHHSADVTSEKQRSNRTHLLGRWKVGRKMNWAISNCSDI